eukprot:2139924-Rhodomonas_salina.1
MRNQPSHGFAYGHNVHKIDAWHVSWQPPLIHSEHFSPSREVSAHVLAGNLLAPELLFLIKIHPIWGPLQFTKCPSRAGFPHPLGAEVHVFGPAVVRCRRASILLVQFTQGRSTRLRNVESEMPEKALVAPNKAIRHPLPLLRRCLLCTLRQCAASGGCACCIGGDCVHRKHARLGHF